jgi:hypothetical protein
MNRRFSSQTWTARSQATRVLAFDMPPDGEYLIVALDKALAYVWVRGPEADARRAAALARVAPLATRLQARQGTTIKTTLTVQRRGD